MKNVYKIHAKHSDTDLPPAPLYLCVLCTLSGTLLRFSVITLIFCCLSLSPPQTTRKFCLMCLMFSFLPPTPFCVSSTKFRFLDLFDVTLVDVLYFSQNKTKNNCMRITLVIWMWMWLTFWCHILAIAKQLIRNINYTWLIFEWLEYCILHLHPTVNFTFSVPIIVLIIAFIGKFWYLWSLLMELLLLLQ